MKSFIGAVLFICVAFSANAQLLWKVSGNGLNQPSYIIGTHHLAPFSIMDSIAGLQKAMKETQQVYGELKMSEMQSPVTMQKMQQVMMIANDSTLSTLLSPEDFATANKFCKENLMLDLSAAPKLKPAFLLNNVVVAAYVKHIGKFNPQEQLDTFFQSQATQNGKKVDGLETAEFQFNLLFNGYSLQRQAQLLMCTINNINTEVESLKKLTNAYMRQDLNQMLRISADPCQQHKRGKNIHTQEQQQHQDQYLHHKLRKKMQQIQAQHVAPPDSDIPQSARKAMRIEPADALHNE